MCMGLCVWDARNMGERKSNWWDRVSEHNGTHPQISITKEKYIIIMMLDDTLGNWKWFLISLVTNTNGVIVDSFSFFTSTYVECVLHTHTHTHSHTNGRNNDDNCVIYLEISLLTCFYSALLCSRTILLIRCANNSECEKERDRAEKIECRIPKYQT